MSKIILAVVGLCGSGKTEAVNFLEQKGFPKVYFGNVTFDEMKKRGLEINEKNERMIREEMREKHGMGAYALFSLPKIKGFLEKNDLVVIESLYSWDEYKIIKEEFGDDFYVLAIHAPPKLRYKRMGARKDRMLTEEESKSRDYSQIENLAQAGPIAMADFLVSNIGAFEEFHQNLEQELLHSIINCNTCFL